MKSVCNNFNKLIHMYFFNLIWISGCLFSLPVLMCVLDPVLSCCCYAVLVMTDSIFRFFSVLLQRVGYTHMFVVP
jgi:hypothetical protein